MTCKWIAVLAAVCLTMPNVHAEPLDLVGDSPYCQASRVQHPELNSSVIPVFELSDKNRKIPPPIPELEDVAHSLNAHYLRNMVDSTYQRLVAAQEVGIDLGYYQTALDAVQASCSHADRSGQGLGTEAAALASLPKEVQRDYSAFGLSAGANDRYLRRLIVATLESHRIHAILARLSYEMRNAPANATETANLKQTTLAFIRRLIRLQHRYPILLKARTFGGGHSFENMVNDDFIVGIDATAVQDIRWNSDPDLEEKLALTPAGLYGADQLASPMAPQLSPATPVENYYKRVYDEILSGRRAISRRLIKALRGMVDDSVRESISSAWLKCQNVTPCSALGVQPSLTAALFNEKGANERLGPYACACRLDEKHEWVPGNANLTLGLVSAGAVVVASVYPVDWLVYAAYALAIADSGAAASGIGDSYFNVKRSDMFGLMRAGGAVDPIQEFDTEQEFASARYNTFYNLVTGIIGLVPPGRIMARAPGLTAREIMHTPEFIRQSSLEFAKGASGMPAPELAADHYQSGYDPRSYLSRTPPDLRERWPALAAAFDRFASQTANTDSRMRDEVMGELKKAAQLMATSGSAVDTEMLKHGQIRRDLLPNGDIYKNLFIAPPQAVAGLN